MSDEIVEQPISPEVADVQAESVVEAPVLTTVEQRAMAAGWKPLDQFEGDKADFRSAREFLDRGELLDSIKGLKRTINEQKDVMQHLADFNKKIEEDTRKRVIAELETSHRHAVEVGDVAAAEEAAKKLIEANQVSISTPSAPAPLVTEEAKRFVARNAAWFNNDSAENSAMTAFAIRRDMELTNQGLSPEESLKIVESEIRKSYAHRFHQAPSASAVAAPSTTAKVLREDDARSLPEYHQKMIKQLESKLKNFDRKAYIANVKKLLGDSK